VYAGGDTKASEAKQKPEATDSSKLTSTLHCGAYMLHITIPYTLQDAESQLAKILEGTDETITR